MRTMVPFTPDELSDLYDAVHEALESATNWLDVAPEGSEEVESASKAIIKYSRLLRTIHGHM